MNDQPEVAVINKILRDRSFSVPLPPGYSYKLYDYRPDAFPDLGLYAVVTFDGSMPGIIPKPVHTAVSSGPLCPATVYDPGQIERVFTEFREQIRTAAAEHFASILKLREEQAP